MNRIGVILLIFSIPAFHSAYSQFFQSTNYREGSGLPSSESYMVYQDSNGFIWIATDNGVVKYDGHEFVTYNTSQGLSDNTVFGFYEDHRGRIWFRTYSGALSYYENDSIKHYKFNGQLKQIINSSILLNIYYDDHDNLYFSTSVYAQAGKLDSTGRVSFFTQVKDDRNFIRFVDDHLLIGAAEIPKEFMPIRINDQLFHIELDDPRRQTTAMIACVRWKGKLYFTVHKNMFVYDGTSVKKVFTAKNAFISLYVDQHDRLWAGYFNAGVQAFEDESLERSFTLEGLSDFSVTSVMQDYEDGLWISTLDQGVFYYPNLTVENYRLPNGTHISSVAYAKDQVFLGNYDGEVFRVSDKGKVNLVGTYIAPIRSLFLDKSRNLWISDTQQTLIHGTGKYVTGAEGSTTVFRTLMQFGDYVVGANSVGVYKISSNGVVVEKMEARKRPDVMTVTDREIFVGGMHGLEKFNNDFTGPSVRITELRTSALENLDSKYVIVGTIGQGMFVYDCQKRDLTPMPLADVINIYSIVSDWPNRRLWVGTEKGLFQLDFSMDTSKLELRNFSKAAGLVSSKINNVCRVGDRIWAISDLGISSVPLDAFNERDYLVRFYINQIHFKNRSISGNVPVVRTEEANMVIDVRAITYKGYPVFFRYRLNDDQPWRDFAGESIFLTELQPDAYNVQIQASSGVGDWSNAITLRIVVIGKWWESWVFRWSILLALVVFGYGGYWLRIRTIRRKQKLLELINLHQQKLIDSEIRTQERERKRIATDLHDGIGASLSSIKIQISDAMTNDSGDHTTRAKEINENISYVIEDIKRIVYDLNPPGLERYGLHAGLKSLVDRLNKSDDLKVIFDYYGQREIAQPISITIFRILQELINNTLKHARASEIRIHINEFDDEINIMYEDNGIGMVGGNFTGLGLHSIESRVRSLNGRMSWESNHKGTFYNFDIPF